MELHEFVNQTTSKGDFLRFLEALRNDFKSNPDEWENGDLDSYLDAIQAWVSDMEGYFKNQGIEIPTSVPWNLFANILFAEKMYE